MAPSRVPHFGGKSFEVEIRPLASKNPVCLPRKKDVRWCRVGFCILAYYRGASCLPACPCTLVGQDGAPWGAPPNAPAGYPKHAGAFFHGVVGSSTESSSMPNPGRTWLGGLVVRLSCRGACLVARLGVGLFGYPAGVPRLLV
ncbi:unnamed protein product [Lupinus luteus]|uniref:Uncharacterized protein n=1 Tax=Lupinus luteus TaxID=3873 RepID=A0AAV1VXX2_LUPLU